MFSTQPVRVLRSCALLALLSGLSASQALAEESVDIEVGDTLMTGFRVLPADATPQGVFGEASDDMPTLRNNGGIAIAHDGVWLGNLERLSRTQSYWLSGGAVATVTVAGEPTDPDITYQLYEGINFVSFPCAEAVEVPQAIPDDVEAYIESIFGTGTAASNIDGVGWVGMSHLEPGGGYQFILTQDIGAFRFECPGSDDVDPYVYGCTDGFATNADSAAEVDDGSCTYNIPVQWEISPGNEGVYSHVLLHDVRIDGAAIDPDADAVGAFIDGSLVGFGYSRDGYTTIAVDLDSDTAAGDPSLSFQVYDASEDAVSAIDGQVSFQAGKLVGGCMDSEAVNYNDWADFDIGNCVECETEADCGEGASVCEPMACEAGQCVPSELDCDDGDSCTEDNCDETEGCVNEPLGWSSDNEECGVHPSDPIDIDDKEGCGCAVPLGQRTLAPFFLLLLAAVTMRRKRQES